MSSGLKLNETELATLEEKLEKDLLQKPKETLEIILDIERKYDFSENQQLIINIKKAHAFWNVGEKNIAFELLDNVISNAQEPYLKNVLIKAYTSKSQLYLNIGNSEQAIHIAHEGLAIAGSGEITKDSVAIFNNLVLCYHRMGNFTKSIELGEKLIYFLQTKSSDNYAIAKLYNNIANSYEITGKIHIAQQYYTEANKICKEMGFKRAEVVTLNNIGDIWRVQGFYDKAKEAYLEGIDLATKYDDSRSLGLLTKSYAEFLMETGEFTQSKALIVKAIKLLKDNHYYNQLIDAYRLFTRYYMSKGNYEKALQFLEMCYEYVEQFNIRESEILILVEFAEIWRLLGDIEKSYTYLKKAEKIASKINSEKDYALILLHKAKINLSKRNFHETELALSKALSIIQKTQNRDLEFKINLLLTQNYIIYYQHTQNSKYLKKAMSYIIQIRDFTKKRNLLPEYLSGIIILGLIQLLQQEFYQSYETFSEAEKVARQVKMFNKLEIIKIGLSLSSGISSDPDEDNIQFQKKGNLLAKSENLFITLILDQLRITNTNEPIEQVDFSKITPDHLSLVIYRIDSKFGVVVQESDNVDFNNNEFRNDLLYCGNLYATTIGQGKQYHQGLFGPLPFGSQKLRGLIYTKNLPIYKDLDARNSHKNYFLFSLIFPEEYSTFFSNQSVIEPIFKENLNEITSLAQLTKSWIYNFKLQILQHLEVQHSLV